MVSDNKDKAISVEALRYRYPQAKGFALNGVSFSVQKGSFTALVGPSGCGKTTLLLLARGFANELGGKIGGRISIFCEDVKSQTTAQLGGKVAIVFQNPSTQLHQLTVFDEVASSLIYRGFPYPEVQERAGRQVEAFLGKGFSSKSPQELSGGQQQRVALAAALALDAPIVLLDEPFSFLDSKSAREILKILLQLKNQGKTIVLSTHHIDIIADVADAMLLMDNGKVVLQGTPEKVLYGPLFARVMPPPLPVRVGKLLRSKLLAWEPLPEKMKSREKPESAIQGKQDKPLLEISNITFSYPGKQAALRNASLSINKGEIFGLIGANGSGKTTLAKCVLGLLKPQKGKVILSGQDITNSDTSKRAKAIGFVTQDPRDMFCEMNLVDEVAFGPKNFGIPEPKKKAEAMLGKLNLSAMKDRHPDSLSGGQKSLLGLADILVSDPEILVLDEPEFGLDPGSWRKVTETLKELSRQGRTIVIITQDLEAVMFLCDRCALMKEGEIAAVGSPKNLFQKKQLIESAGLFHLPIFQFLKNVSGESLKSEEKFAKDVANNIYIKR